MIVLNGIVHSFSGRKIFDGLNLHVAKGEKIALKGRSGTGKSTLLNIIMGFILPDSGDIIINGTPLSPKTIAPTRRLISWLPQSSDIAGSSKARDVIMHPFSFAANKEFAPRENDIMEAAAMLKLDHNVLDSNFEELSGGEKQRVGIIICKLLKRPLVLLDEPTSALDKESLALAADYILSDGSTVLSTSHDEQWIDRCDRIVEL